MALIWNDAGLEYLAFSKEQQLLHVYQESLDSIKSDLNKMYEKSEKLTYSEVAKYNRLQKIEQDLIVEVKALGGHAKKITRSAIKEGFENSYYFTGFTVENHTGINFGFTKLPTDVIEAALEDPYDWAKTLGNHSTLLKKRLKDTIVRSLVVGASYPKMIADLTGSMNIGMRQAKKLLVTEVHKAQVLGRLKGIEQTESAAERLQIKTIRKWRSTFDERTRASHRSMNFVAAGKDNMFTLPSGAKTRGPGLSGIAEEDIFCRCAIIMEFPGYEPDIEEATGMLPKGKYSCLLKKR